ncbi:MAG TPA: DUF1203 domain-containing protein [Chthoniobacterales bacterium]|nr:DUF1203 domain-containing protein [Chthoniobacterales bacterium]
MKTCYRIVPLPTEVAETARRSATGGAPDHATVIADSPTGYPCRHCLRWAKPGEPMILFPFTSVPAGHPYSESGPIFVHAEACDRYGETHVFPSHFRKGRVLRAYDSKHLMIGAEVVSSDEPEAVIEKLLENPETDFIHVRSATRGCYTFRIERA